MATEHFAAIIASYSFYEFVMRRNKKEYNNPFERPFKQACIMFLVILVGTIGYAKLSLWLGYLLIASVSFVFDCLWKKPQNGQDVKALERFIIRQIIITAGLYFTWRVTSPQSLQPLFIELQEFILGKEVKIEFWLNQHLITGLFIVSAFLFMIDGGAKIVRGVLNKFGDLTKITEVNTTQEKIITTATELVITQLSKKDHRKPEEITESAVDTAKAVVTTLQKSIHKNEKKEIGEWIGILERIITLVFVFTGSYTAIAFALTAKSIARFKELENKDFAEYYLLGTSTSLVVAILTGIIVKTILGF